MNKGEQNRIKLFEIITKDENEISVKNTVEIFAGLFLSYFENTKTGKAVKAKLTTDEYISYVTGFLNSFISSLYVTAAKDRTEQKERMKLVGELNKDVLVTMEEFETYGNGLKGKK